MENTTKIAALISYITSEAGHALDENSIRVILAMIGELRADYVPLGRLLGAIKRGAKIEAIKEYRTLTGSSLLDAKNAIEANWINVDQPAQTTDAA